MSAQRAHGFTLLEVLVALAIVVLGMAAVLGALTSSADTVAYLRDKTFANWVALNQVAQVRISGQTPQTGKSDGDVDDFAGRKWHWHQEVTALQLPGMLRIEVSARPTDAGSDSDRGWYATLSGIYGDAVGAPRGDSPNWGAQTLMPGGGIPGANPAPAGTTPPGATPGIAPGGTGPTPPPPQAQPTPTPTTPGTS